jgi:hypothetical protein
MCVCCERAVVSILAGIGNFSFVDGSGTNAGFFYPLGAAVDASGNVFVADEYNQRIRKVTADGGTRIGPWQSLCTLALRAVMSERWRERAGGRCFKAPPIFPIPCVLSPCPQVLPVCFGCVWW